jgi:hypothetical protein
MGDNITPIGSVLIRHLRLRDPDDHLIELKLWKVPPTEDKPHGFKYSMVYVVDRKRVVGYDNGERRGDHRHLGDREEPYEFVSIDRLIEDFMADVARWRESR